MSQFSFGNINEATTDGFGLATMLENFEAAVNSAHAGATAPSYKITGTTWRDTSVTPHLIKQYDGANWLVIGSLNTTTHEYALYHKGAVLTGNATATTGDGLEISSNALRVKLDGTTIIRSAAGIKVDTTQFATAAQGALADTALQPGSVSSGIIINRYVLNSSTTYTKPANLLYIDVECVGGGGNGGGGTNYGSGGGGGGGGYTKKMIVASAIGVTETVTVGGVSGTSSFGTHCSATGGGTGGNSAAGGGISAGGGAGLGVGGDIVIHGTTGRSGLNGGPNPATSTGQTVVGGDGGGSIWGGGGNGAKCSVGGTTVASGTAGSTYGGGGGGGASLSGGTRNGGAGIQGVVIVTEYIST